MVEAAVGEKLFMRPNPKQQLILDGWKNPEKKVFTLCGGNRLGKTVCGVVVALSTVFGKWLWDDTKLDNIHHRRPRKVRYIGSGWETHVKGVVIPALKFWWPKNRPLETRKNNQGVEAIWKDLATGSTVEIMSTSQQSDVYEGWDGDLVVYDEPPPRDIRVACARGLIDRNGREFFVATLLKEAWLTREVIRARLPNGEIDETILNVVGKTYDNLGYGLTSEGVEQFKKTLKPDEVQARIDGIPSDMFSLVCPKFSRDLHVIKPFKIPLDWIVDINIDFHPSRPWAISFWATARNNFKYACKEMEIRGNPKFVGEEIVRYIKDNNLRVGRAQIDPLAKGDANNDQTVFEILGQALAAYGISLDVASKDKDNGIAILNNLLFTENSMPGLFIFKDCVKTIQGLEDWTFDPETFKPSKENDDFCEVSYRLALMDTQWFPSINYNMSEQKNVML
jgi:hypothetical protein